MCRVLPRRRADGICSQDAPRGSGSGSAIVRSCHGPRRARSRAPGLGRSGSCARSTGLRRCHARSRRHGPARQVASDGAASSAAVPSRPPRGSGVSGRSRGACRLLREVLLRDARPDRVIRIHHVREAHLPDLAQSRSCSRGQCAALRSLPCPTSTKPHCAPSLSCSRSAYARLRSTEPAAARRAMRPRPVPSLPSSASSPDPVSAAGRPGV
jgi:hypothetical protein